MKRTQYEITITWVGSDGKPYQSIDALACGKTALAEQVAEYHRWHAAHNHTDVTVTVATK